MRSFKPLDSRLDSLSVEAYPIFLYRMRMLFGLALNFANKKQNIFGSKSIDLFVRFRELEQWIRQANLKFGQALYDDKKWDEYCHLIRLNILPRIEELFDDLFPNSEYITKELCFAIYSFPFSKEDYINKQDLAKYQNNSFSLIQGKRIEKIVDGRKEFTNELLEALEKI